MNFNLKISGFLGTLVYFALGLLTYLLFYAPTPINWANPWLYIVTVLWPFVWLWKFLLWGFIILTIIFVAFAVYQFFTNR